MNIPSSLMLTEIGNAEGIIAIRASAVLNQKHCMVMMRILKRPFVQKKKEGMEW